MSIPKIIHYCWFGGNELPENAKKCIESWKKYCPDYQIMEWNETNCDLDCCAYVREAYEAKKWAFITDVVRLHVLVEHGGIYMDTDVEVLKPLDGILSYAAVSGFETEKQIPTGLMACEKGHPLFVELLHDYDDAHFIQSDGSYDLTTNVKRVTDICLKYGLQLNNQFQTVNGFTFFPKEYFCPKDYDRETYTITENTYTIHHFNGSWLPDEERLALEIKRKYARFLPRKIAGAVGRFQAANRYRGFVAAIKEILKRFLKN